jgi:murein L,D-transpeptidase YafK
LRTLRFALVGLVALTAASCEESTKYRGSARHHVPIPGEMYALMNEKAVSKGDPILIRSFKKESELEVWKRGRDGRYVHLKTYPICRWSGQLGPKKRQGDRMTPEGFYAVTQSQMNPNSSYYLAFNMGFPNAYDRSHGYNGDFLMVHGACSSAGCYSMTDDQIGEIYALMREAHSGGQKAVQMQSYPFRMTAENIAKHRHDPNMAFWKNLKEGSDIFEVTKQEPKVAVCGGRYGFGTGGGGAGISPSCDVQTDSQVASAVSEKRRKDEVAVAGEIARGTPAIKLVYEDGDQHRSFKQILASGGEGALHSRATWASRDVGISRSDALQVGPRIVLLDNNGKPRSETVRAANTDSESVLAAARQLDEQKTAQAAMTPKPVEKSAAQVAQSPRQPTTGRNARGQSQVAKVEPPKAEEKPAETPGVMQRMMALNPFAR